MPIIPGLVWGGQDDQELKASLNYEGSEAILGYIRP